MRHLMFASLAVVVAVMLTGCSFGPPLPGSTTAVRVNCGALSDTTDAAGLKWVKDQPFKSGSWGRDGGTVEMVKGQEIKGTYVPEVYRSYAAAMKAYRFTLPNGKYTVQLHFAEIDAKVTKPGQRVFSVAIEGLAVIKDLDLAKTPGPATASVKAYDVTLTDGELDIEFTPRENAPIISAIEILQP